MPSFSWQQGSLFDWVGVFCIKVDEGRLLKNLTHRGTYPFHTPYGLATMTHVLEWLWQSFILLSNGIYQLWHLSLCQTYMILQTLHPHYTSHLLWMLWQTSMVEAITSCWSTPGKSAWSDAGWSPDHFSLMVYSITPLGSCLNWCGAGSSVPCLADTHTQGNASFWCDKEESIAVEDS